MLRSHPVHLGLDRGGHLKAEHPVGIDPEGAVDVGRSRGRVEHVHRWLPAKLASAAARFGNDARRRRADGERVVAAEAGDVGRDDDRFVDPQPREGPRAALLGEDRARPRPSSARCRGGGRGPARRRPPARRRRTRATSRGGPRVRTSRRDPGSRARGAGAPVRRRRGRAANGRHTAPQNPVAWARRTGCSSTPARTREVGHGDGDAAVLRPRSFG